MIGLFDSPAAVSHRLSRTEPGRAAAPGGIRRERRVVARRPRAALLALLVLALGTPGLAAQEFVAGVTPGALAVDPNGQATYEIPIEVPPGIAGMQPSLSLIYNSGAGNGLLGMGWSLGGLSVIQRCPRTIVQDGSPGGIAYDASDRFCLDGKRLVAVNGVYGAAGTEYRTEIDGFFKVVQKGYAVAGDPDSGPGWFQVRTKSGQWMNYGFSANSRIEAVGRPEVREWAVDRIQDTTNNFMLLNYIEAAGSYRIKSIRYTQNVVGGVVAPNRIDFGYEDRPDVVSGYIGGSPITQDKRLTAIWTYADAAVVRRYQLAYETGGATGRSRLTQVRECGPPPGPGETAECLQPHVFDWKAEANPSFTNSPSYELPDYVFGTYGKVYGDFVDANGDGLSDWVRYAFDSTGSTRTWLSTESGWVESAAYKPPFENEFPGVNVGEFVDLNGDGLVDRVHSYYFETDFPTGDPTEQRAWLNTASGWTESTAHKPPAFIYYGRYEGRGVDRRAAFLDVNGDALPDFVQAYNIGSFFYQRTWLNTGSGWQESGTYTPPFSMTDASLQTARQTGEFVDVNGDGVLDFVEAFKDAGGIHQTTWLSTGAGWVESAAHKPSFVINDYSSSPRSRGTFVDVNGDGLSDYVQAFKTSSGPDQTTWLNTGAGWVESLDHKAPFIIVDYSVTPNRSEGSFVDMNGDGLSDFVQAYKTSGGTFKKTWLSTGTGWFEDPAYEAPHYFMNYAPSNPVPEITLADINGDGIQDWIRAQAANSTPKNTWLANTAAPDQLLAITGSLGAQTTLTYRPLTDKTIYEKFSDDVYPIQDIQPPMYVVSEVARDDGWGGQAVMSYTYAGAKTHVTGRGFLGFRFLHAEDRQTGTTTSTFYAKGFPYIGQVLGSNSYLADGTTLSTLTNTWAQKLLGGTYFPYVAQSVAESYEPSHGPGNQPVTTVTTEMTYGDAANPDYWGNPTEIVVTTTDGTEIGTFVTRTVNTYDNFPSNWLLGRLRRAEVTKTLPGGRSETRVSTFDYYWPTGLLKFEVIEPDSLPEDKLKLSTYYTYDVFGNVISKQVSGPYLPARTTTTDYPAGEPNYGRFPTSTTNALGHTETRVYDARFGTVTSQTGPNLITTTWEYDTFGRKLRQVRADGTETRWSYEVCLGSLCPTGGVYLASEQEVYIDQLTGPNGSLIELPRPYSARKTAYYDILNRVFRNETEGFAGEAIYADTLFNAKGEVWKVSRPYFPGDPIQWTETAYDTAGRPESVTEPNGTVTTSAYDGLTSTTTKTFRNTAEVWETQRETRTKDAIGQLVKVTDNDGNTVDYTHDPFGNLETTTVTAVIAAAGTPLSVVTAMSYDIRGRKISMDDPNMGVWTYEYNALGELEKQTDAKGQTIEMTYDLLGRMETRTETGRDDTGVITGVETTTWVYDTAVKGIGKLHYVTQNFANNESYVETQSYDDLGRPSGTTIDYQTNDHGLQQHVVSNTYDSLTGQLKRLTYPSGFAVERSYTPTGYLESVSEFGGAGTVYWQALDVNADGQVEREVLGNDLETLRAYDAATGLIAGIGTTGVAGAVQELTYAFDGLGNLAWRADGMQNLEERFVYDGLNRLTYASLFDAGNPTVPLSVTGYAYDGHGNITSKSDVGLYDYGGIDGGPHAVTGAGGKTYAYDANGSMISSADAGGTIRSVTWSAFNKPVHITSATTLATSDFVYGPGRARIRQSVVDGAMSKTVYYVGNAFERHVKPGDDEEIHYIRTGSTVAIYTRVVDDTGGLTSDKTRYLHRDHLGSVDVITDEAGDVLTDETGAEVGRLSFDAHGKRRQTDWRPAAGLIVPLETPRGFTGHEHLDKLGLIHMNGRVYDPELGRFLSADPNVQFPETTQGFNRYTYAANNPLSFTDPSGFFLKKLFKKIKKFFKKAWKWIKKNWQSLARVALAAVPGWGPLLTAGFSGLMTVVHGGSLADVFQSVGMDLWSSAAFMGLHQFNPTKLLGKIVKVTAHGVVGGGMSAMRGGSFKAGFLSAAAVQGFTQAGGFEALGMEADKAPGDFGERLKNAAVAGTIGGASSLLGGGKFANGAITGAFSRLYNDLWYEHRQQQLLEEAQAQQDEASNGIWVGGKVEAGVHYIFPGVSGGVGALLNPLTGELCTYAEYCARLGPGVLIGAGGKGTVLIGPESGEDLDGVTIGIGGDIIVPGAPGAGGSAMVGIPFGGHGGASLSGRSLFGAGLSGGVDVCLTQVLACR